MSETMDRKAITGKIRQLAGVLGAFGAGAMLAKDSMSGSKNNSGTQASTSQQQTNELYAENEKLRNRNKEAERRIEDLTRELQKANARFKDKDDSADDLEDDLADAKAKIRKLTQQNDELLRKVQEYKMACESYEEEIQQLKNK